MVVECLYVLIFVVFEIWLIFIVNVVLCVFVLFVIIGWRFNLCVIFLLIGV